MLAPLTRLMDKLTLTGKFAVIGGLFAVSTAYLAYSLYQSNQTNIDFSAKERLGVDYIAKLPALLVEAQRFSTATARAAAGDAAAKPAAEAVDGRLAELGTVDQRLGDELATHPGWQALTKAWADLRQAAPSADTARKASDFVAQIVSLEGMACDNSNLTLDPDIDSYYLMDTVCSRLPTLMARIGERGSIASAAIVAKQLGAADRTRLIELRPLVADASDAMHGNFDKVFAYNASLKALFTGPAAAMDSARQQATQLIAAQALGDTLATSPDAIIAADEAAILQAGQLAEQTRKTLDRLLGIRIDHMQVDRNAYVAVAVATLLATVLLLAAMYRSLVGQLGGEPRYAFEVIQEIARGRLDTSIKLRPNDETSLLAAMRAMRNQLREVVASTLGTAASIAQAAEQLTLASDAIACSTHAQTEAASTVAAAVEELTESISFSAGNAQTAQSLSVEATAASSTGDAVIRDAVVAMNDIADTVRHSADAIRELNERSAQIGQVVGVIKEVAEQTNLLALNAAIEAARAGESGRGFAVVADEVRKLAERTAHSTAEINEMVAAIQHGTRSVSASMDREVHEVDSGVGHASEAGQAIAAIRDRIDNAAQAVGDIANSLREQRASSTLVAQNIEKIAQMSAENDHAVQETFRSAQRLSELAGGLKASVAFFHV